jgi:SAM-dependent methyltransferase
MSKQWYENWFDSPYYHKLYFDRDEHEASMFIENLIRYLQPESPSFMLDVACGKGRHARTLASYHHFVTGIDISPQSIAYASQYNSDLLEFLEHDMRLTFRINYYKYAFNLFTSFGYFDSHRKNEDTLRTIYQSLQPGGIFIFDYLNAAYIAKHLVPNDEKIIDGTRFLIKRYQTDFHFIKQIQIEDATLAIPLLFEEKVASYNKAALELIFEKVGFTIKAVFGNYSLHPFDEATSPRVIIIAEKYLV